MTPPTLPKVADSLEMHADWLEWRSLVTPEHYASWSDHQRDLRIGGSDESMGDSDDELEVLTDDIAAEIQGRIEACGSQEDSYPFDVTDQGLHYLPRPDATAYKFQLLLTLFGRQAGPPNTYGDRLFEDLCAEALRNYLGGSSEGLEVLVFGFPRRVLPSGFKDAVDEFCRTLREGIRAKRAPETDDQKDAHLDLVAWRGFPESRPGQLIVFGQCSTGMDWFDKIHELQPNKWCQLWLEELPLVHPLSSFFVPRRIELAQWRRAGVYGGILFDRCRTSWLLPRPSPILAEALRSWVDHVLASEGNS
jgi:hypothetical protein